MRNKPSSADNISQHIISRLVDEDGSEMLDAEATAAGTWADSGRQPGWIITL